MVEPDGALAIFIEHLIHAVEPLQWRLTPGINAGSAI